MKKSDQVTTVIQRLCDHTKWTWRRPEYRRICDFCGAEIQGEFYAWESMKKLVEDIDRRFFESSGIFPLTKGKKDDKVSKE